MHKRIHVGYKTGQIYCISNVSRQKKRDEFVSGGNDRLELTGEFDPLRRIPLLNSLARACERSELSYAIELLREALLLAAGIDIPVYLGQTHINLARCLLTASSYEEALAHLVSAEEIFRSLQDKDALTDVQYVRSLVYVEKGELDMAFNLASIVYQERKLIQSSGIIPYPVRMSVDRLSPEPVTEERSRRNNEYKLGTASRILSIVEASRREYTKALHYIDANFELWQRLGEEAELASSLENAATIYSRIRDFERAIDFFERALAIYRTSGAYGSTIIVLTRLAAIHTEIREFSKAFDELSEAWNIPVKSNYVAAEGGICIQFAKYYIAIEEYPKAQEWAEQAREIADSRKIDSLYPQVFSLLGKIAFFRQEYEGARSYLARALEISQAANQLGPEVRSLKYLYLLNKQTGRPEEALSYLERYQKLEAALLANQLETNAEVVRKRFTTRLTKTAETVSHEETRELSQEVERLTERLSATLQQVRKKDELLIKLEKESLALFNYSQETQDLLKPILTKIRKELHNAVYEKNTAEKLEHVLMHFMKALRSQYPELTKAELRICALLRMDMSSREIAKALNISTRTVENHRMHIRQKLQVDEYGSLQEVFKRIASQEFPKE